MRKGRSRASFLVLNNKLWRGISKTGWQACLIKSMVNGKLGTLSSVVYTAAAIAGRRSVRSRDLATLKNTKMASHRNSQKMS